MKKTQPIPSFGAEDRPSRPRPSERETRAPMAFWDRIRFLLLLGLIWLAGLAVVWTTTVAPLGGSFDEALSLATRDYAWVLFLMILECVRQLHCLIEEHSKGYFAFWEKRVFARSRAGSGRLDDWTRYRVARAFKFFIVLLAISTFLGRLFNTEPVWLGIVEAPARLVTALPFVFQLAFGFFFIIFQFIGLFWFLSRGGIDTYMPDEIETRFDDVKGQDPVLDRLRETMIFLEAPEAIEERGGYVPGGVLLWGPPGTGKTLMAQAVAGETARPFVFVDPGAFIQMFMGVGILKVKGLYRKLRRLALRYGGVIVFFDEADSLGNRGQMGGMGGMSTGPWATTPGCNGFSYLSAATRSELMRSSLPTTNDAAEPHGIMMGGFGGGGMGTLQALLSEMSGLEKPRGLINKVRKWLGMKPKPPFKYRILHIFATNMPSALDQAMLRPGRIDRQYKVGYPTKSGRKATFEYYLAKINHDLSDDDIDKLATITPYGTGASIKDFVNEGVVVALRDGRELVTYKDVIRAKHIKQLGVPDDFVYIERERHATAVHEACHAVAVYRLSKSSVIDIATIERRGDVGGMVVPVPPEDQMFSWKSDQETDIITSLASLAGERMFFDGDHSVGVGGDMQNATQTAVVMLGLVAMGDTIAAHSVSLGSMRGAQPIVDGSRTLFDGRFGQQVEDKLQELYAQAWQLLDDNRAEVLGVAHALETHKTVTGDDVTAVIEGTSGPTVDGRPYHDPAFRQMLENYHAAALRAHKAHGGVDTVIPVPLPPPPVDAVPAPAPTIRSVRDEEPPPTG